MLKLLKIEKKFNFKYDSQGEDILKQNVSKEKM